MARTTIQGSFLGLASQAAGDVMYFNGTNWIRLAKGSADEVLTMNNGATAPEWEVAGSGAVTREGGQSTEVTSTSNSQANYIVMSSLSIAVGGIPCEAYAMLRKTSGAASTSEASIRINSQIVGSQGAWSTNGNNAQSGIWTVRWQTYVALYDRAGGEMHWSRLRTDARINGFGADSTPNATITSVAVVGAAGDSGGAITMGVDEGHVYSLAIS